MGEAGFDPQAGDLVYDTVELVVARVMDAGPTRCALRKLTGGVEWDTHRSRLRRPTVSEELAAKAAAVNADTRIGRAT